MHWLLSARHIKSCFKISVSKCFPWCTAMFCGFDSPGKGFQATSKNIMQISFSKVELTLSRVQMCFFSFTWQTRANLRKRSKSKLFWIPRWWQSLIYSKNRWIKYLMMVWLFKNVHTQNKDPLKNSTDRSQTFIQKWNSLNFWCPFFSASTLLNASHFLLYSIYSTYNFSVLQMNI